MKKYIMTFLIIFSVFIITGCQKEELREVKLNEVFSISKNEEVLIDKNNFKIVRLGNASCKRGETCVFDGLKVEYVLTVGNHQYTKENISDSEYDVKIGKTDYKNFVEIIITKKD